MLHQYVKFRKFADLYQGVWLSKNKINKLKKTILFPSKFILSLDQIILTRENPKPSKRTVFGTQGFLKLRCIVILC